MSKDENPQNEDRDRLKFENELKKIKLSLEKGAIFSNLKNNNDLPPEIEREFLKNIETFEKKYDKAERILVYDLIGKPGYKKADSIPEKKIGQALDDIMDVLNNKGIILDTLCDVDDRVLYTFITNELFFHEIDKICMEGMAYHFIYEEFHPNHEYDIRNHSTDFIQTFLNKDTDFYTTFLTKEAENDNDLLHFRDAFGSFSPNHFSIVNINFNKKKARVIFETDFTATIEKSSEVLHFKGKGTIEMLYRYDFWCVHKVKFPAAL